MKSLILKTLSGALIAIGLLSLSLWVWGDDQALTTEIRRVPTFSRSESLEGLTPVAFSKENLTEKVSQKIADEIIALNPEGPVPLSEDVRGVLPPDVNEFVAKNLSKAALEFKLEALIPKLTRADLVIVNTTDPEAIKAFFLEATRIIDAHFEGVSINLQEPEKTNFPKLLSAYDSVIRDYLKLPVPAPVADLHLRQTTLISANKNALTLIGNYQTDPLQAALAIQAGEKFANDLIALSREINRYLQTNKINLAS